MTLRNSPWRSLKAQLALSTLAIFLLGIWSLNFYGSHYLRKDMTADFLAQEQSAVSIVADIVNEDLKLRFRTLDELAGRIAPLMSHQAAFESFLKQQTSLQRLFNGGIIVTDRDGTTVGELPLSGGRLGVNYRNDKWISSALERGKSMVSPPIMGKVLHSPVFAMTVPVRDGNGSVIGTASGVIDLGKPSFLDVFTEAKYGPGGNFLLVSPQSRLIVTASDKHRIMKRLPPPGANPSLDLALDRDKGTSKFVDPQGVEVLTAGARVPVSGWHVVASLPYWNAFAPLRSMHRRMQLVTFLLSLLVVVVIWLTMRRQLMPISEAARALATASRTNQLPQPLPVVKQNEIGELTSGFNRLLETLDKRDKMLRESEAKFRALFQQAGDYAFVLDMRDPRGPVIVDANEAACEAHGYTRDELLGKSVREIEVQGRSKEENAILLEKTIAGEPIHFETVHRRKDGSVFPVEVTAKPVQLSGKTTTIFSIERDISERKRLEESRRKSQRLESLGTLAGGIAHDFNNILAAIRGNADLAALDLGTDHPAVESIEEIRKASDRARDLVRRIMAFGRPKTPQRETIMLGTVVREVVKFMRSAVRAEIDLQPRLDYDVLPVHADSAQVHEALVNLTNNAAYAIGPGVGQIEYLVQSKDVEGAMAVELGIAAGRYVRLTVKDNGSGIDEATKARIFDAFFTTKPLGEGSGLGLSMVYGIMRGHGGAVAVDSAPGKGSCFHLYFPAATDVLAKAQRADNRAADETFVTGKRIMYVDDEQALISLGERVLARLGHSISGYTDPRRALEEFRAHPERYDVVVTDLSMPKISGLDLARKIRSVRADVPVVLTTGYMRSDDELRARKAGIREVISKPMTADELAGVLNRIFGGAA